MADYPISNVARRIVYTGSAGVGPYAFPFEVLTNTDINVYKNDTLLTLTTNYTVTISPTLGTGSITLVVAATGSDRITIIGARAIQRTTDFTTGGDFFANTLNDEMDSQTILVQQVAETAERSIKAPVTDPTSINMTLPKNTDRAGKLLSFNASTGNPETINSIGDVGTVADNIDAINTIADSIESGTLNSSLIGHIASGTGATARTVQSKLRDTVSVKDYGAVGDGTTDDTAAIQAAINSQAPIFFPTGTYLISNLTANYNNLYLKGENATLKVKAGTTGSAVLIGPTSGGWASKKSNVQLIGLSIDSTLAASVTCIRAQFIDGIKVSNVNTTGGTKGLDINTAASVHVDTCSLGNASAHALLIESATDGIGTWVWVSNSTLFTSGNGAIISNIPTVWFDKNVVYNSTAYGLTVQMDVAYTTSATYANITNNDFDSCGSQGLILTNQTKFNVTGNWVSCGRTNTLSGISISSSRRGAISDNQLFSNGLNGLILTSCNDVSIVNNTSTDNTLAGIYLDSSTNIQIIGNTLARTSEQFLANGQDYGVYALSSCSSVNVISNTIYGNLTTNLLNLASGSSKNIFNSAEASPAGTSYSADTSDVVTVLANNATIAIPSFSGQVTVNCLNTGGVQTWLAGGGAVTSLGTVSGGAAGTLTFTSGISGYTFTNTSGSTYSFTMLLLKTRNGG